MSRLNSHLNEARRGRSNTYKTNWLRELQRADARPDFIVLNAGLWDVAELDAYENQAIASWRLRLLGQCCALTNGWARRRLTSHG
ncbi:MAG: hypothetical protein LH616_08330 [Ilumatobacteraceae bacterium]|nr:hypothetical protein [Ilumatobacteraceae bacterium]